MSTFKKTLILIATGLTIFVAVYLLYPTGEAFVYKVRNINEVAGIENGMELIYPTLGRGNIETADNILNNDFELSRFAPVHIDPILWNEDPYGDIYWRFNFYNLEPVRHLTFAWLMTGDPKYQEKIISITDSFFDEGMDGSYSWDLHGVALRTMTLVNTLKKLVVEDSLENGDISEEYVVKYLKALEEHGAFLADEANYERGYNHGLDQAVALFVLTVNVPQMPKAEEWRELALKRINENVEDIVDTDGILVENAPYYHFYVLDKLWAINSYLKEYDLEDAVPELDKKIDQMVEYGTYVLQPDLHTPTIGASLSEEIELAGVYREIANEYPRFMYVLTRGAEGKRPKHENVFYPDAGQTIMRSGWGPEEEYERQTQLIFDVGSFRTNHSDFDALSFNLYSEGLALMPDSGLYSYEGPYRTYFQGTRAHNTVVVDGKDQMRAERLDGSIEKVHAGTFEEGNGYVYQSGAHELYQGVEHQRAIALVEGNTIVILDTLESEEEHEYEQMFHLAPGATIKTDDLTLSATWEGGQSLTIRQLMPLDVTLTTAIDEHDPPNGLCATEYATATPCYAVSYAQRGTSASFITVITIGDEAVDVDLPLAGKNLEVDTENATYLFNISNTEGRERNVSVEKHFDIETMYGALSPVVALNAYGSWWQETTGGYMRYSAEDDSLKLTTYGGGDPLEVTKDVSLDLVDTRLYFKTRVSNGDDLADFAILLSNNNWTQQAEYNLQHGVYGVDDIIHDNEWYHFALGESLSRNPHFGAWRLSDASFDWSNIDKVRIVAQSEIGRSVTIDIKDFATAPEQSEEQVVILFDDGWASVLGAAEIMHKYDIKGNVPVITSAIGRERYLTLDDLKKLQNDYGWNIVNHTNLHKNAVAEYVKKDNFEGYEHDVTDALVYLLQNDLNSAPNWFVYPNGKTDPTTEAFVRQYYTFARSTVDGAETFPFPEPHEVKILSIYTNEATMDDVFGALEDAKRFNQTVMLMFHKFSDGTSSVFTEWELSDFEKVIEYIHENDINVSTLSELDAINGVPESEFTLQEFEAPQFTLDVAVDKKWPIFDRMAQWLQR